jgi:hypothetical protein
MVPLIAVLVGDARIESNFISVLSTSIFALRVFFRVYPIAVCLFKVKLISAGSSLPCCISENFKVDSTAKTPKIL